MSKFTTLLNNFAGGKVSDKFRGLSNSKIYQNSMEEFKNFFIGKIGGAHKRTGTVLTADLSNLSTDYTNTHTAIPFDTGRGTPYFVFLPSTVINFDGGTNNDFWIVPNDGVGLTQYAQGSGITTRFHVGFPAFITPAGTPFTEGHWIWQQVGDLLFLTHSSGEQRPLVIARTSPTTFELNYYDTYYTETENLNIGLRVPYKKNRSSITFNATTPTEITASSAYFTADMVGSFLRVNKLNASGISYISSFVSPTVVNVTWIAGVVPTVGATDDWEQSYWSNEWGWPTTVTYHQSRLFWGGSPNKNFDFIWASLLGNLFHMMRERLDQDDTTDVSGLNFFGDVSIPKDPTDFRPASTQSNAITWISGGRVLMSGTSGGENLIKLGVETIDIVENSNYGSSNSQVVKAGKDVIYVGKDRRSLRTYRYSDENGSWLSDDLSSKADTLFLDGAIGSNDFPTIKQMAWNPETKQLWVLLSNNNVKVLSYDPEYGLSGWSDFDIGGDANKTVLSIVTLPNAARSRTETYFAVERTIDTGTNIYLESIMGEYNNTSMLSYNSTDIFDFPRFVDCAHLATADVAGLLQARDPSVLGNFYDCIWMTATEFGYVLNVEVILDGLDRVLDHTFPADAKVVTGYLYTAELKPLPLEAGGEVGTGIHDIKDIDRVHLNLYRSIALSIGSKDQRSGNDLNFEDIEFADLTTDEEEVNLFDNPDSDGQPVVRSLTPMPLNILSIVMKGTGNR